MIHRRSIELLEARRLLAAAPEMVIDLLPPETGYSPYQISQIRSYNGDTYFVADDLTTGFELWRTDGTAGGTSLVKDIAAGTLSSAPYNLVVSNGTLFFTANDNVNGVALWKTDGTPQGTVMVKDIDPSTTAGDISSLMDLNGTLLLVANDGVHGAELWRSDGTADGTVLVKDIYPGALDSTLLSIMSMNGVAYFGANDSVYGRELWRSDGTADGTWLVKDMYTGPDSGFLYLGKLGNSLVMSARHPSFGYELWKSDGTEPGTTLVKDINPAGNSYPATMTDVGGTLFFAATTGTQDTELWKSDLTSAGTVRVKNIRAGILGSTPLVQGDLDGIAILTANNGITGREVWRSDGTDAGTYQLGEICPGNNGPFIGYFTYQDGLMYFSADDLSVNYGTELYRTDGTIAGTYLAADISPGTGGSSPSQIMNNAGVLYFAAGNQVPHYQLWKLPDQIAPRVVNGSIDVQTSHKLKLRFSEDVSATLSASDVKVQLTTGGPIFSPDDLSFDPASRVATLSFDALLPDGRYTASIQSSAVSDASGHTMTSNYALNFFILTGDADRSQTVDTVDFNLLAANLGQAGKTFSQGNFDYDPAGNVDTIDFGLLSANFGTTVPAADSSASPLSASGAAPRASMVVTLAHVFSAKLVDELL